MTRLNQLNSTNRLHSHRISLSFLTLALGPIGCAAADPDSADPVKTEKALETISPIVKSGKSRVVADAHGIGRAFEVNVPKDAIYFVRIWAMGMNQDSSFDFYRDGDTRPIGVVFTTDSGWHYHSVGAYPRYPLITGLRTLTFYEHGDHVPEIEAVEISKSPFPADDDGQSYGDWVAQLRTSTLDDGYSTRKQAEKAGGIVSSPPTEEYCSYLGSTFSYTFRTLYSFVAGQSVVFETRKSDPNASDPVLYLVSASAPQSYSWSNDDCVGYQSCLAVTIPVSGSYWLLARSYSPERPGTSDLYKDGALVASDIVLSGNRLACSLQRVEPIIGLEYFTSHASADTMMWLVDQGTPHPGTISAFNDDYGMSGEFDWGLNSRVRRNSQTVPLSYAIVSAFSAKAQQATADVYLENKQFHFACPEDLLNEYGTRDYVNLPAPPYMPAESAIWSGSDSMSMVKDYNCIAWSGGMTDGWQWPPDQGNPWYDGDELKAFDKFYGNDPPRFPGAYTYSRTSVDDPEAVVDLWGWRQGSRESFSHGSVRKPGDGFPHGFDWESKPGALQRIFHPRRALRDQSNGSWGYGDVLYSYRWTGGTAPIAPTPALASGAPATTAPAVAMVAATASLAVTPEVQASAPAPNPRSMLEHSIRAGVAVVEAPVLTDAESQKIRTVKMTVSPTTAARFNALYDAWKGTLKSPHLLVQSNPRMYTKTDAYKQLLEYCQQQGRAGWVFVFERLFAGDSQVEVVVNDLAVASYPALLESIRKESARSRYTGDGRYIVPSLRANLRKLAKRVLPQL